VSPVITIEPRKGLRCVKDYLDVKFFLKNNNLSVISLQSSIVHENLAFWKRNANDMQNEIATLTYCLFEPHRRRKFHKPITVTIPIPQLGQVTPISFYVNYVNFKSIRGLHSTCSHVALTQTKGTHYKRTYLL